MLTVLFLVFILTILIYIFKKVSYDNQTVGSKVIPLIPGGLPIFGHMFKAGSKNPFKYFTKLSEKYGPIFKIQIGWKEFIVMNGHDIINKSLGDQGDNFAGRWRNTVTDQLAHYCGILFTEKEWWATQRNFTLKVLKELGFGKMLSERMIKDQMEHVINTLIQTQGKPISSYNIISLATINVICNFTIKKEFKADDKDILDLIQNIKIMMQGNEIHSVFINLFPIFKNFPTIEYKIYKLFDKDGANEIIEKVQNFFVKYINEHRDRFGVNIECQDLIDAFLLKQYTLKQDGIVNHSFIDWQLIRLLTELFISGYETTSCTLIWALLLLARFKDVQKKMYTEIVATIGTERLPTMNDKKFLNYCQAVMDEILRFVTTVPSSIPHRVYNDTFVDGYFIPQDSIIFTNLYACHRDPKIWTKPNDFCPEHFLDHYEKYRYRPELIPFGCGNRKCLGESLVKIEYFIFLITIIQRFKLSLDEESLKKSDVELFKGTNGMVRGAIEHKIIFKEIVAEE